MEALKLEFDNVPVRALATRKIPRIETAGMVIEETQAGREVMTPLWVAWELVEAGLARIVDEGITNEEWTQIHFRERLSPAGPLSQLPNRFYSRAYMSLKQESKRAGGDPVRQAYLSRVRGWFRDVLESRISRVVRLASAEASAPTRALQPEESLLYEELRSKVSSWRREMRGLGEN